MRKHRRTPNAFYDRIERLMAIGRPFAFGNIGTSEFFVAGEIDKLGFDGERSVEFPNKGCNASAIFAKHRTRLCK